ncbi:protein kinase [Coemansia sp. RSA 988]|nr:protein kinase [Coemansia sp. RSA 988]
MSKESTTDFEVPLADEGNNINKVVNFSDFEHQKENIQPLRRGRSASTLALLYGKDNNSESLNSNTRHSLQPKRPLQQSNTDGMEGLRVSSQLQERNAQFQAEIAAMDPVESDDPLDVYFRYVQWLFEVFPQAYGQQTLIRVVERPLRLFREQGRYRNDTRYVKMWIWYTGIITEGQEAVFQFLVANGVGDSLAVLYEEYAKLLEGAGKIRKADEIYQLGIARKAQPLARLERRYDEFQRRVMARTIRDVEQQQQQTAASNNVELQGATHGRQSNNENTNPSGSHRTMLGTKRSGRSVRSATANTLPASRRGLPEAQETGARPNARIAVFSDPDGASDARADAGGSTGPWRDIGTDESRRKENVPEAASWRGQKLKQQTHAQAQQLQQQRARAASPVEKFTVFSDPGDEASEDLEVASQGVTVLAPRSAGDLTAVASTSSSGLLQSFMASEDSAVDSKQKRRQQQRGQKTKTKNEERMVMPNSILFPAGDGVVQSVEEARAKLAQYRFDFEQWQRALAEPAGCSEDEDEDAGIADESGYNRHKPKSAGISSPTINTRMAQKDMLGIWGSHALDSDSDAESLVSSAKGSAAGRSTGENRRRRPASINRPPPDDDDYQFTMGPVTPNVVPPGQASLLPVIPTSTRPSRFETFLDAGGADAARRDDENNPPTIVMNSIRARRSQPRSNSRVKPTPLAARSQPRTAVAVDICNQAVGHNAEGSEAEPEDCEAEDLMRALGPKTPISTTAASSARIPIFHDSAKPQPLFTRSSSLSALSSRESATAADTLTAHQSPPLTADGRAFECEYPPIRAQHLADKQNEGRSQKQPKEQAVFHSTPARGALTPKNPRFAHTPGFTKTASSFSVSGIELTGASGFTGLSTIGGPVTSSSFMSPHHSRHAADALDEEDEEEDDVDYEHGREFGSAGAPHTPMRKRLSMAAKDLGRITPRFPRTPTSTGPGPGHGYERPSTNEVDDDDDDDDDDVEDDEDDPCTENIAEFADLDSQMNELQMELGAKFLDKIEQSAMSNSSGSKPPSDVTVASGTPLFTIFRD